MSPFHPAARNQLQNRGVFTLYETSAWFVNPNVYNFLVLVAKSYIRPVGVQDFRENQREVFEAISRIIVFRGKATIGKSLIIT
jgi:hypothetical protein